MKKETTAYDFYKFLQNFEDGKDNLNDAVLDWFREKELSETRLDKFKKLFPNARLNNCGFPCGGCPSLFDKDYGCPHRIDNNITCNKCYEEYWLEEAE